MRGCVLTSSSSDETMFSTHGKGSACDWSVGEQ